MRKNPDGPTHDMKEKEEITPNTMAMAIRMQTAFHTKETTFAYVGFLY